MAVGETIGKAFDNLYYFERACETYVTALMTGKPMRVVSDAVAEKTARQWEDYVQRVGLGGSFLQGDSSHPRPRLSPITNSKRREFRVPR